MARCSFATPWVTASNGFVIGLKTEVRASCVFETADRLRLLYRIKKFGGSRQRSKRRLPHTFGASLQLDFTSSLDRCTLIRSFGLHAWWNGPPAAQTPRLSTLTSKTRKSWHPCDHRNQNRNCKMAPRTSWQRLEKINLHHYRLKSKLRKLRTLLRRPCQQKPQKCQLQRCLEPLGPLKQLLLNLRNLQNLLKPLGHLRRHLLRHLPRHLLRWKAEQRQIPQSCRHQRPLDHWQQLQSQQSQPPSLTLLSQLSRHNRRS
mmetsp:Transcript_11463/g.25234  ORF Transcript_11463/g.25234 Transcript_11463/m.25234 type:complete len:259 (+) Transcript_11463:1433-2209(+)